jgi:rRNA maturation protein Rpf1
LELLCRYASVIFYQVGEYLSFRMLASLFHYDPQFHGKRVATFHNQRDYIFFRCRAR